MNLVFQWIIKNFMFISVFLCAVTLLIFIYKVLALPNNQKVYLELKEGSIQFTEQTQRGDKKCK